ncbi:hypothetical protein [Lentibacillus amyloliquefaciens]|nr:hypothetical protein [Lentibacillus amyloliquefaciens]
MQTITEQASTDFISQTDTSLFIYYSKGGDVVTDDVLKLLVDFVEIIRKD